MKNRSKTVSFLFLIPFFLMIFTSCNKLKVDNLQANEHFKKGNKYYTEERYKKAVDEYETALKLNPELGLTYKYLGTACAALYKPGDTSEENKALGEKAQTALKKAQELEPQDSKVILALGQLSDKMGNFKEAEAQFLKVLEKDTKNPDIYIILADFYKQYIGRNDEAENKVIEMYDKRIALNPDDPSGYLFPAAYYFGRKNWDEALKFQELHLAKVEQSTTLSEKEKKQMLTEAYYRIGHLHWAHSYQTPADMMTGNERSQIIENGLVALQKAIDINAIAPEPYVYMGLLWLEKDKIDPAKHDIHQKKRDEYVAKYQALMSQKKKSEQELRDLQREK